MSIPSDINAFFDIDDIDKEINEVDMDVNDSNIDNMLDSVLDATNDVGHIWEEVDDDNTIPEGNQFKTYSFPVKEYINWIKDLEKMGLSYV